ncbi:MAG: glycosyltransferase [Candidatus Omnitrophica bacterium]|nr:glycosyltransferase [Candidatus Omnitrophota bacterium]
MKIAIIFGKELPYTMGVYFERALKTLGHQVEHYSPQDIGTIRAEYDLYFRVDDGHYDHYIPERLKPRVYYVSDVHLKKPFKRVRRILSDKKYELVFCPMRKETQILRKKSPVEIVWMNVGCDPDIHKRVDTERTYDVGFVGSDGGVPRKFYLQEIKERYPNSFISQADYREMGRIYSSSKIGLSFAIRGECFTMRNYEIMAGGAMLLMKRLRDDSAEKLGFIDREHLVIFDGPKDLFDLIDYYLKDKQERERIAENGYRLTIERHTYTHRLKEMVDIARERLGLRER